MKVKASGLVVAAFMAVIALPAFGQLKFNSGKVDFGIMREADGNKTVRAFVRNEGSAPAAIMKVRPSCGCTAVSFQKEEIAPGDSAWIELTYNPFRRPGRFEKNVKVYPSEGDVIRIPITGLVVASPETVDHFFPAYGGLVRLSESTLMPLAPMASRKPLYVDVYNAGEAPVWVAADSSDAAVSAVCSGPSLLPGEKGEIEIRLDPDRESREGQIEYTLNLFTSNTEETLRDGAPAPIRILTSK